MLLLHMVAILPRLGRIERTGAAVSRALAEIFVADMDDNMRELGVGDLAVPRKIKRVAAALTERHAAYSSALAKSAPPDLVLAIERNVGILAGGAAADCRHIAEYYRALCERLDRLSDVDMLAGKFGDDFV